MYKLTQNSNNLSRIPKLLNLFKLVQTCSNLFSPYKLTQNSHNICTRSLPGYGVTERVTEVRGIVHLLFCYCWTLNCFGYWIRVRILVQMGTTHVADSNTKGQCCEEEAQYCTERDEVATKERDEVASQEVGANTDEENETTLRVVQDERKDEVF